jgi:hypothetical protein
MVASSGILTEPLGVRANDTVGGGKYTASQHVASIRKMAFKTERSEFQIN